MKLKQKQFKSRLETVFFQFHFSVQLRFVRRCNNLAIKCTQESYYVTHKDTRNRERTGDYPATVLFSRFFPVYYM